MKKVTSSCLACLLSNYRCLLCGERYCALHTKNYQYNTKKHVECCVDCLKKKLSGVRNALRRYENFAERKMFIARCPKCFFGDAKVPDNFTAPKEIFCTKDKIWLEYKEVGWTGPNKFTGRGI